MVAHFDLITIFPGIFESFLNASLIKRARDSGLLSFDCVDLRKFSAPPHFNVDDVPYGGGPGMVLKPEPLVAAIENCKVAHPEAQVVLLSSTGRSFNQKQAREFSQLKSLILVCGRYEGVDQRVIDLVVDHEVSIGDYVLMGGEVAAMVLIEAISRLIGGVVGNSASIIEESFTVTQDAEPLLEAPQYTRPPSFRGLEVPEVLLSGNHQEIARWRRQQAVNLTTGRRPDLIRGKN